MSDKKDNFDPFEADVLLQKRFRQEGDGFSYKTVKTLIGIVFLNDKFLHMASKGVFLFFCIIHRKIFIDKYGFGYYNT